MNQAQAKQMQEKLRGLGGQVMVRFPDKGSKEYRLEITPEEAGMDAVERTKNAAVEIFNDLFGEQALKDGDIVCKPRTRSTTFSRNV